MKARELALDIRVAGVPRLAMPPNCEVIAKSYVGDFFYGVATHPNGRELYLLAPEGYWRLDLHQLLATFSAAIRDWDQTEAWTDGRSLTGFIGADVIRLHGAPVRGRADSESAAQRRRTAEPLRRVAAARRHAVPPARSERRRRGEA